MEEQLSSIERSRNIPQLRFPEFEGEWVKAKFKKLVKLQRGSSPRPIVKYITNSNEGVNWIKIGDIDNKNYIINKTAQKITPEGAERSRYVKKGEIILSNSMSFGRPCILEIDGFIHDGWFVLREYNKNFHKEYLCQLLGSEFIQKQYYRLAAGGVVSNISSELVNSVIVNLPSLPEQQKIASFLTDVDDKITQLTKKKSLLEQYKKGMMQKIFNQELRFKPDLSGVEGDDNGNEFPKWQEKKLGKISNITTGSSNRQDSGLDGEFTFFDRSEDIRTSSRYLFDGEAIIVAGEGSDFIPKYYKGKFDLHQRTYAIMEFKEVISKYLFYYIHFHRRYFLSQAVGSTVKSLRLPMFQKMLIKLPVKEEQSKIANFLSDIDIKIEALTTKIENSKTFKKGLLQQMFV